MQLSEAIRLGAMLGPQGYGNLGACALRAASDAVGVAARCDGGLAYTVLRARWPILNKNARCPHPRCLSISANEVIRVIYHLNDDHHWTRERIADWVATVEPARHEADASATSADAVREDVTEPIVSIRA